MWSIWTIAISAVGPRASIHDASCEHGNVLTDRSAACLMRHHRTNVTFRLPVVRKEVASTTDGCLCTQYQRCTSNGVDVRPRCGCQDFTGEDMMFCYVVGSCPSATQSVFFAGALYRACVGPPPPPPQPLACTDPLSSEQWHLDRLNVYGAWSHTRGAGSTVVIVDDGLQYMHPDLNIDRTVSFGWDTNGLRVPTADSPLAQHGTASAGVAAAIANNAHGGCGISHEGTLAGVKLLQTEATADSYMADDMFVDTIAFFRSHEQTILSNSWGPPDDLRVDGPGKHSWYDRVDTTLRDFGVHGRSGKGGITVFAAGNGGWADNVNDDGFASHPYTITVGAVGDDGRRTPYSEPGACIDVVAPSDGGWRSIVTTDLIGDAGYAPDNSTDFGGTSAATPMVAATIALLLAIRPDLALRDVRQILQRTALQTDPHDDSWVVNAAQRAFSPWYGYGLVDVGAAVERAASWENVPPVEEVCGEEWIGSLRLPEASWTRIPLSPIQHSLLVVDEARVYIEIDHPWRGDILLSLVSPHGTRSRLTFHVPAIVPLFDIAFVNHTFASHAFAGETGERAGWFLEVHDVSVPSRGFLRRVRLCVTGEKSLEDTSIVPAPSIPPALSPSLQPRPVVTSAPRGATTAIRVAAWSIVSGALICGGGSVWWAIRRTAERTAGERTAGERPKEEEIAPGRSGRMRRVLLVGSRVTR